MKTIAFLTLPVAALALVSCENPADSTADAEVGPAESASSASGEKYVFTDTSSIEFTGSKLTGAHDGGFKAFDGYFTVAEGESVPNGGKVVIDMTSTWSDNEKLTGHLKSADFFDVAKFPESVFEVTSIDKNSDSSYRVAGNFTLHGVTRNIAFPASVSVADDAVSIKTEFDINRKDFEINFPGKPDDLIRDQVVIRLDLTASPE